MQVDTGRLMDAELFNALRELGEIKAEGCIELIKEEQREAINRLQGKHEVYLDERDPLRQQVTKRYNDGLNRKQRRAKARKESKIKSRNKQ